MNLWGPFSFKQLHLLFTPWYMIATAFKLWWKSITWHFTFFFIFEKCMHIYDDIWPHLTHFSLNRSPSQPHVFAKLNLLILVSNVHTCTGVGPSTGETHQWLNSQGRMILFPPESIICQLLVSSQWGVGPEDHQSHLCWNFVWLDPVQILSRYQSQSCYKLMSALVITCPWGSFQCLPLHLEALV